MAQVHLWRWLRSPYQSPSRETCHDLFDPVDSAKHHGQPNQLAWEARDPRTSLHLAVVFESEVRGWERSIDLCYGRSVILSLKGEALVEEVEGACQVPTWTVMPTAIAEK